MGQRIGCFELRALRRQDLRKAAQEALEKAAARRARLTQATVLQEPGKRKKDTMSKQVLAGSLEILCFQVVPAGKIAEKVTPDPKIARSSSNASITTATSASGTVDPKNLFSEFEKSVHERPGFE